MASSPDSPLTPLQKDVLAAFFSSERGFFLTGGAALAGYWLRHRPTGDLDLFTLMTTLSSAPSTYCGKSLSGSVAQWTFARTPGVPAFRCVA
jgi:hypothetical protein